MITDRYQENKTPRVVCAALKNIRTLDIIIGVRHFDNLMTDAILQGASEERWGEYDWADAEQGFINSQGEFLTRREAYISALRNNQIIFPKVKLGDSGELSSENIY